MCSTKSFQYYRKLVFRVPDQSLFITYHFDTFFSADHENQVEENKAQIKIIRERWVEKLEQLVNHISNEFSTLFEYMGFSGCVKLNKGTHEDDFLNYGFDVLVKFRAALPLTRLDGTFQSKFFFNFC